MPYARFPVTPKAEFESLGDVESTLSQNIKHNEFALVCFGLGVKLFRLLGLRERTDWRLKCNLEHEASRKVKFVAPRSLYVRLNISKVRHSNAKAAPNWHAFLRNGEQDVAMV